MEKLVEKGLVRSIGLSNFNSCQIDDVLSVASIKPTVLQVTAAPQPAHNTVAATKTDQTCLIQVFAILFRDKNRPVLSFCQSNDRVFRTIKSLLTTSCISQKMLYEGGKRTHKSHWTIRCIFGGEVYFTKSKNQDGHFIQKANLQ